jgi:hypothetical protein
MPGWGGSGGGWWPGASFDIESQATERRSVRLAGVCNNSMHAWVCDR